MSSEVEDGLNSWQRSSIEPRMPSGAGRDVFVIYLRHRHGIHPCVMAEIPYNLNIRLHQKFRALRRAACMNI